MIINLNTNTIYILINVSFGIIFLYILWCVYKHWERQFLKLQTAQKYQVGALVNFLHHNRICDGEIIAVLGEYKFYKTNGSLYFKVWNKTDNHEMLESFTTKNLYLTFFDALKVFAEQKSNKK